MGKTYFHSLAVSIFTTLLLLTSHHASASDNICQSTEYTAYPPFIASQVTPNVLFMLDNSGSMKQAMYGTSGWRCNSAPDDYDDSTDYYGLFEENLYYSYDQAIPSDPSGYNGTPYNVAIDTTVAGAFVTTTCTPGSGVNCWKGNYLNWITTRRMDAARKVLVGGKVESRSGYPYLQSSTPADTTTNYWKILGNNEPQDYQICRTSPSTSLSYSPHSPESAILVDSPANNGSQLTNYDPYAKIYVSENLIYDKDDKVIGEFGSVSNVSINDITIPLSQSYSTPVIVLSPPSHNGGDDSVMRLKDVNSTSFKMYLDEWKTPDGGHNGETVFYAVFEAGTHILTGNLTLKAERSSNTTLSATTTEVNHNFTGNFPNTPIVAFTGEYISGSVNTVNVRPRSVTQNALKIYYDLRSPNAGNSTVRSHIIAMQAGTSSSANITITAGSGTGYDENWKTLNLPTSTAFLAGLQKSDANDIGWLRYQNFNSTSAELFVEDPRTFNPSNENLGYISFNSLQSKQYNIALLVDSEPQGLLQEIQSDVRQGVSFYKYNLDANLYNAWWHGGTMNLKFPLNPFVKDDDHTTFRELTTQLSTDTATLVDAVEHYPLIWGQTPLAENYYEVIRYFQQKAPFYDTSINTGSPIDIDSHLVRTLDASSGLYLNEAWDPYYFEDLGASVSCVQSSIILFTDGGSFNDQYVPPFNDTDFNESATASAASAYTDGITYSNDYDGDQVGDEGFSQSQTGNSYRDDLDDLAYWANRNRSVTETSSNNRDLRSDLKGDQYLTTYTVGFGITAGGADERRLQNTADNGKGEFYLAKDGAALNTALREAITSILNKAASGTGVTALSEKNSSSGLTLNQSIFYPSKTFEDSKEVAWTGALHAYWYYNGSGEAYIKEDNDEPFYLNKIKDNIIFFEIDDTTGELSIPSYEVNTDGSLGAVEITHDIGSVNKVWDAGLLLNTRTVENDPATTNPPALDTSRRMIFGVTESDTLAEFTHSNIASFDGLFGVDGYDPCLGNSATDRAENIISYTRGVTDDFTSNGGSACRTRVTNNAGDIWKLGDIVYSTPQLFNYGDNSLLFVGANDGMLHAFNAGYLKSSGLSGDQISKILNKKGETDSDIVGKEVWSFIPKNTMPYLKYLPDPSYLHLYALDGTPYFAQQGDKSILIMGMRFGGATGSSDAEAISPPDGADLGRSAYFALDITDPYNPTYLWEFTDDDLGFSYSGPSIISRENATYVMFLSGPNNYAGKSTSDFSIFVLEMDDDFKIANNGVTQITPNAIQTNSFGGRLYNNGLDIDDDGYTDIVLYGLNERGDNTQGQLRAIAPTEQNPAQWDEKNILNSGGPVVSSVVSSDCFDRPFVYFGAGRWFFKGDSLGKTVSSDTNAVFGVNLQQCYDNLTDNKNNTTCLSNLNINSIKSSSDTCDVSDSSVNSNYAWKLEDLLPRGTYKSGDCGDSDPDCSNYCSANPDDQDCVEYGKERNITDPTVTDLNVTFFTTTQPTADICSLGGRTRVWALNCITGDSIIDGCADDESASIYNLPESVIRILLPLSGGDINQLDNSNFTENGNRSTEWLQGLPPEGGPTILPTGDSEGELLLWQEK